MTEPENRSSQRAFDLDSDATATLKRVRVLFTSRVRPLRPLMALLVALAMATAALMLAVVMVMGFRLPTL